MDILATMVAVALAGAAAPRTTQTTVEVVGTEFVFRRAGAALPRGSTVGAILTMKTPAGPMRLRIDAVWLDPQDREREVVLYRLSEFDTATGRWRELCEPDADGLRAGFPLAGSWSADGTHLPTGDFSLTCISGAQGKCVRFGYKPWKPPREGISMWDLHQACTRMVRADYCGRGVAHTVERTLINVFDPIGIQKRDDLPEMSFEAGWGPTGAVCVNKTRVPSLLTREALLVDCPRLAAAPPCDETVARHLGAVVFNESR